MILTAIGLMSGTSADAVDAVLVRTNGLTRPELLARCEQPFLDGVRERILALIQPGVDEINRLGGLDRELGELFAEVALEVCRVAGVAPGQVDVIGSHGQTARHAPPTFTLQIGGAAHISKLTGITTVADFRPADVARGGQGAPLTPMFHRALFAEPGKRVAVVNLGGIANITALPAMEGEPLSAGDTGPANSLIDLMANRLSNKRMHFDADGEGAASGQVDHAAVEWLLKHPHFAKPFPKSTGREVFGAAFLDRFLGRFPELRNNDGLATLTHLTVVSVAHGCELLLPPAPERLVLCGGGARNPVIVNGLQALLPNTEIVDSSLLGVDSDLLEAQAFAWFAVRTIKGLPSSLPEATGASEPAVLGAVHPGLNWAFLMERLGRVV